jgi:hypothetical protein
MLGSLFRKEHGPGLHPITPLPTLSRGHDRRLFNIAHTQNYLGRVDPGQSHQSPGISDEREQSCTYARASLGVRSQSGEGRRPGEPRCLINTARFCVLRVRLRCGLPPSSRAKPAPAWSCFNAGIRHAQNPALWCSADCSSGKTRGRRGNVGNKGVGFDEDGAGGGEASSTRGTRGNYNQEKAADWLIRYSLFVG